MPTLGEEIRRNWVHTLLGTIFFVWGVWLLVWNEGRAVHHIHSLDETFNNAIILNPYDKLNPEYDGRVVHISGDLVINEPLTEPEYGISIQAVKLRRRVQMYQWVEVSSGADHYYYEKQWRDKLVDTRSFYIRFGHTNPTEMPLKSVTYVSDDVQLGPLKLGAEVKSKFTDFFEITSDERPERKDIKLHMGIYYHCEDIWNPEVGDIRVQFYYAGPSGEPVTIVAKQQDGVLVPYETSKGHYVALVRHGDRSLNDMFSAEHLDARRETWKWRLYGCLILWLATNFLVRVLRILFSYNPYLVNILSGGNDFGMKNILVSAPFSLFIIAINWVFYRPMIAAGLILAAFTPFFYCIFGIYNVTQDSFNIRT